MPLSSRAATRAAASYPPQLCEECANLVVGRHDKPRRKVKCARLKRIQGSASIKSASFRRICVSAAQVKERGQGSRKRAPRWWLAAAEPDFVLGARLGINWTPFMGLHRHGAQQRHRCVRTHSFVWASRFPGSTVGACREGSKSYSKRVHPGTSRNAQAVLWVAQQRPSGYPLWSDACSWRPRCKHRSGLAGTGCTAEDGQKDGKPLVSSRLRTSPTKKTFHQRQMCQNNSHWSGSITGPCSRTQKMRTKHSKGIVQLRLLWMSTKTRSSVSFRKVT